MRSSELWRSSRGSAVVEFALATPVLLLVIIGLVQLGQLFSAQAGMANAVNEAARYATTYPTPTDAQIMERMRQRKFMVQTEHMRIEPVARGTANGVSFIDLTLTYSAPLNFVFFSTQPVQLRQTRRAYVS
jgi:hypothetical protein